MGRLSGYRKRFIRQDPGGDRKREIFYRNSITHLYLQILVQYKLTDEQKSLPPDDQSEAAKSNGGSSVAKTGSIASKVFHQATFYVDTTNDVDC